MDCLVNFLGTEFDYVDEFNEKYKNDGIIWFLESCDLNVFAIRRAMWQMEKAGWFKYVKAFVIGRPYVFGQEMIGLDQYGAVLGIAETFARIFYRNSINIGLPIIECPEAAKAINAGDDVAIDFDSGVITDKTTGQTFQGQAFPEFMQKIIKAEGLVNYINNK